MGFTEVDGLIRGSHHELIADDKCLFLREYNAHGGFKGETNRLIWNLKKKPSERFTKGGWQYKALAIQQFSRELAASLNPEWLDHATLVPIPGSKAPDHPDYDDRMEQICRGIRSNLDVRCLVKQTVSLEASHAAGGGNRASVDDLVANYQLDESIAYPVPTGIGIVDDVLTVGRHYRAMHTVLTRRFPACLSPAYSLRGLYTQIRLRGGDLLFQIREIGFRIGQLASHKVQCIVIGSTVCLVRMG